MNYRKANNLCFQCGEPYNPAHAAAYTKKPKAQANALVVNDLDMRLSEEILTQLAMEDSISEDFGQLSLNAISGTDSGEAVKLRALVKNQVMLTLVDSGSSHSFVSAAFLNRVGIVPVPTVPKQVRVANGEIMISDSYVLQFTWWCNGHTLQSDMRVLHLCAFDAILGYDWLALHSPMTCHWTNKTLEFLHNA
jgi:hypothetical protein